MGFNLAEDVITVPYANYTPEEVVSRGEAIYKEQIRDNVEAENKGKFLVIDIETGDYEIDVDDLRATMRALAKRPAAILYGLRIGYPTAYRLGGRFMLNEQCYTAVDYQWLRIRRVRRRRLN